MERRNLHGIGKRSCSDRDASPPPVRPRAASLSVAPPPPRNGCLTALMVMRGYHVCPALAVPEFGIRQPEFVHVDSMSCNLVVLGLAMVQAGFSCWAAISEPQAVGSSMLEGRGW